VGVGHGRHELHLSFNSKSPGQTADLARVLAMTWRAVPDDLEVDHRRQQRERGDERCWQATRHDRSDIEHVQVVSAMRLARGGNLALARTIQDSERWFRVGHASTELSCSLVVWQDTRVRAAGELAPGPQHQCRRPIRTMGYRRVVLVVDGSQPWPV